ncbi:MAG: hypothetical protein CSYNP_02243 [Syntrophus sp. SKADARSKE-3]|nr:hypothetical protein [Syntrophus sp. SKADARSKE-3]
MSAATLAIHPLLGCSGGSGGSGTSQYPKPEPGETFFTQGYDLPHAQNAQKLAEFLASEHFEYHLDGWFFMGDLVQGTASEPLPVHIETFFIAMQRIEMDLPGHPGFKVPFFPAIVGFNSALTEGFIYGAIPALDDPPVVVVTPTPWSVSVNWFGQVLTMALVSGQMGATGAKYRLFADILDLKKNKRFQAEVLLRDRLGVVNQGYGTASFFPQFLTTNQRRLITGAFESSVPAYLASTQDPMICQGSFYYSFPLIDVEQFTIIYDGVTLSHGQRGTMWMDYVVQTYDKQAQEALIDKATWQFFAIRLPNADAAIMVIQIDSATGSLAVASLFNIDGHRTRNNALMAAHSWDINEIEIKGVEEDKWESPRTHQHYYMQYRIHLSSATLPTDITIKMLRQDQEIEVPNPDSSKPNTIKYEGEAFVEGTLGDRPVKGMAFLEVQPAGHQ